MSYDQKLYSIKILLDFILSGRILYNIPNMLYSTFYFATSIPLDLLSQFTHVCLDFSLDLCLDFSLYVYWVDLCLDILFHVCLVLSMMSLMCYIVRKSGFILQDFT